MARDINVSAVTEAVRKLCIEANYTLPQDAQSCIAAHAACETWPLAKSVLGQISENIEISRNGVYPLCQDTGVACVFVELGQQAHVVGGNLETAINEGVRLGYEQGYLRKSVVGDPLNRKNTGTNTPAVITYNIVDGDGLKITVAPKGFGSENMSQLRMMAPAAGVEGVKEFVLKTVVDAGPNPCPPIVVGVGIGGTFDKVAALAKKALLRDLDSFNENPFYAELEKELLDSINALGIGPQGFGGKTTALKVNIETFPTHIAGLPVAVNINCHVSRHASAEL